MGNKRRDVALMFSVGIDVAYYIGKAGHWPSYISITPYPLNPSGQDGQQEQRPEVVLHDPGEGYQELIRVTVIYELE